MGKRWAVDSKTYEKDGLIHSEARLRETDESEPDYKKFESGTLFRVDVYNDLDMAETRVRDVNGQRAMKPSDFGL